MILNAQLECFTLDEVTRIYDLIIIYASRVKPNNQAVDLAGSKFVFNIKQNRKKK